MERFLCRKIHYLRINQNLVLQLALYIPYRHKDWFTDLIFQVRICAVALYSVTDLCIPKEVLSALQELLPSRLSTPSLQSSHVEIYRGERVCECVRSERGD